MKKHSSFFRKKHKPRASAYIPTKYLAKESWVACNTSQNKKKELKATRGANKIRKSKVSRILLTPRIALDEPSLDTYIAEEIQEKQLFIQLYLFICIHAL